MPFTPRSSNHCGRLPRSLPRTTIIDTIDLITADVLACTRCPELREYTAEIARVRKRAYIDQIYHGAPVPGFGDPNARVLLVGLAPGAHGSNRTGRMFTGDGSGVWLYRALHRAGFASSPHAVALDDGLTLEDAFITAGNRCAPPGNKPTSEQKANCFPFLVREFWALAHVSVIVSLGRIADDSVTSLFRSVGATPVSPFTRFAHGAEYRVRLANGREITRLASYHPSLQNTNTGVLTESMLDDIFARASALRHG